MPTVGFKDIETFRFFKKKRQEKSIHSSKRNCVHKINILIKSKEM